MWTHRQIVGTVIGAIGVGMVIARWIYILGLGKFVFFISAIVLLIGLLITFSSIGKKQE